MHIKQAVHTLTQQLHRLGWRTEQSLGLLAQWRCDEITRAEFESSIDQLLILDLDDLTSDELADLELYQQTIAAIKMQGK